MITFRSGESPFVQIQRIGFPEFIAELSPVAAYSGGVYAIQTTSVADTMLLFATAPFITAVLGWICLREKVRMATWISIVIAVIGISIMVADKSGEMLPAVFLSELFGIGVTLTICLFMNLPIFFIIQR